ncbi:MAG: manganese-binding transcriptional regulator MntR [Phycisphaerae bacterium]|nr:manganese-binding transcriptional regulator MntR [Phycisphaerae bacterium]
MAKSTRKSDSATKQSERAGRERLASARAAEAAREAARHSKTRGDHAREIAEDYVELIAHLSTTRGEARTVELAERLGVSHVTVNKTIRRLAREGLVSSEPYRSIFLTDRGKQLASASAERHALVVRFLCKLGVEAAQAEIDAEGIEHHISDATMTAIQRFVG